MRILTSCVKVLKGGIEAVAAAVAVAGAVAVAVAGAVAVAVFKYLVISDQEI